jgi:hypothetical protein
MKRNVIALALLGTTALVGVVFAVEQEIEVAARMRIGLSFANAIDMNFTPGSEHIDFYGTPDPTADFVKLGTDGGITVDGTVFEPSAVTATPGSVDINSDGTSMVNISCSASARLEEAGGKFMTVDLVQVTMNTGTAYTAPDYTCLGTGTTPHPYQLTGTDKIILGGRLVGKADVITAAYSTTVGTGTPITVQVLYQ